MDDCMCSLKTSTVNSGVKGVYRVELQDRGLNLLENYIARRPRLS
jgi:hypothetical protein